MKGTLQKGFEKLEEGSYALMRATDADAASTTWFAAYRKFLEDAGKIKKTEVLDLSK